VVHARRHAASVQRIADLLERDGLVAYEEKPTGASNSFD